MCRTKIATPAEYTALVEEFKPNNPVNFNSFKIMVKNTFIID